MMKLLSSPTSPYVRKVRIVMIEKKLDYQSENANVWDADTRIQEHNPLGKVPCLVTDDGSAQAYDALSQARRVHELRGQNEERHGQQGKAI